MMLSQVFLLRHILMCFLPKAVLSADISVTAYPGIGQHSLVVYTEKLSFLDAMVSCSVNEHGMFSGPFFQPPTYIKSEIRRHQWDNVEPNLQDGLWIGAVKLENTESIIHRDSCEEVQATAGVHASSSERQCLYLNMSTDYEVDTNFNLSSCDVQRSYVCLSRKKQALRTFRNVTYEGNTPSKERFNITEADCQDEFLSGWFSTYVAEYNQSGACMLFKSGIKKLPKNITLTSVKTNSFIIMKGEIQVILNTSSVGISSHGSPFPCITTSSSASSSQVTTMDQTMVNSTKFYSTSITDHTPLEDDDCDCICTENNQNKTEAEIQTKISELRNILSLDKRTLTTNKRKKISAYDDRKSSKALGSVGIVIICSVIIVLFMFDTKTIMDVYTITKS